MIANTLHNANDGFPEARPRARGWEPRSWTMMLLFPGRERGAQQLPVGTLVSLVNKER